jgi:hypothetical protein
MPTIDYDAFERERAAASGDPAEPLLFRFRGKDYPLPHEVPATVVLDAVRLRHQPQDRKGKKRDPFQAEAQVEQLVAIGDALFGPEAFREILASRGADGLPMGSSAIGRVVMAALGATSGGAPEETARPNRATRRAQKAST